MLPHPHTENYPKSQVGFQQKTTCKIHPELKNSVEMKYTMEGLANRLQVDVVNDTLNRERGTMNLKEKESLEIMRIAQRIQMGHSLNRLTRRGTQKDRKSLGGNNCLELPQIRERNGQSGHGSSESC